MCPPADPQTVTSGGTVKDRLVTASCIWEELSVKRQIPKTRGKLATRSSAGSPNLSKTSAKALSEAVPAAQWEMPAGFTSDGKLASLSQVVDPKCPTLTLAELSDHQRAELTIKRIEAQPKFRVEMLGAGTIDKHRAVAEIEARSKIGSALMEIEQRVINNLVERAGPARDK